MCHALVCNLQCRYMMSMSVSVSMCVAWRRYTFSNKNEDSYLLILMTANLNQEEMSRGKLCFKKCSMMLINKYISNVITSARLLSWYWKLRQSFFENHWNIFSKTERNLVENSPRLRGFCEFSCSKPLKQTRSNLSWHKQ